MSKGRYGVHGGQYIPETLMNEIIHLEQCYEHYKQDPEFNAELDTLLREYAGRPSLLYYAEKMTDVYKRQALGFPSPIEKKKDVKNNA